MALAVRDLDDRFRLLDEHPALRWCLPTRELLKVLETLRKMEGTRRGLVEEAEG